MGNRRSRYPQTGGLGSYGPEYDPNYGMEYYGGPYEPYGYTSE